MEILEYSIYMSLGNTTFEQRNKPQHNNRKYLNSAHSIPTLLDLNNIPIEHSLNRTLSIIVA